MKAEVAVLSSPSLMVLVVFVDVKHHCNNKKEAGFEEDVSRFGPAVRLSLIHI